MLSHDLWLPVGIGSAARKWRLPTFEGAAGCRDRRKNRSKDILGRVYEYFLSEFASAEGKKGGQFYTPRCVVQTLVGMLAPYKGRVFDPCCGSGGMFVQADKFVKAHATGNGNGGKAKGDISVYGQESNPTTWRLAQMNLAIRGIEAPLGPHHGDSFRNDLHKDLKADYVLANPPFNDARKLGVLIDRVHRELTDKEIQRLADTYHAWRGDPVSGERQLPDYEDMPGFCKSATTDEIKTHGYVLTPGRYVGAEELEEDDELFDEKMQRLATTLDEQFAESAKLEAAIRSNLKGLGYGE